MIVTHEIHIDLQRPGVTPRIYVVQDDKYSRNLKISLFSAGVPWVIPEGTSALVRYRKPDGTGGIYDTLPDGSVALSMTENAVTVALAPQVLTVAGTASLTVTMIKGNQQLTTFSTLAQVTPNASANLEDSEDYFNVTGFLPAPISATVGQYLVVEEVDADGKITKVKAVEAPTGGSDSSQNGNDGFSPVATVEQTADGAVITITDKDGTTTATVVNGKEGEPGAKGDKGDPGEKGETGATGAPGADGKDGTSVTHSWNGTTLSITSASGTSSADLKGDKGDKGDTGVQGEKGDTGATGPAGKDGSDYVLTDDDKAEIASIARAGLAQVEAPKIVSSVDDMTDTTKHYVLDGYIYHSKQVTVPGGTTSPNVFDSGAASLNTRLSGSSGSTSAQNGGFVTDFIPAPNISSVTPYNMRLNWELTDTKENKLVFYNSSKARVGTTVLEIGTNATVSDGETAIDIRTMSSTSGAEPSDWSAVAYIRVQIVTDRTATQLLTADDVAGRIITLDVNNVVTEPTVTTEWVNSGISYAPTFKTDLIGVLGEGNVVYLSDNLPAGTYTLKTSDGYATVGTITVE